MFSWIYPIHRLPHHLRDHGGIIVNCEGHGTLKSVWPGDKDAETAIEWVGGDPRFMRTTRMPAASDNCRLDALAAVTGNTFDGEDRERHRASLYRRDGGDGGRGHQRSLSGERVIPLASA